MSAAKTKSFAVLNLREGFLVSTATVELALELERLDYLVYEKPGEPGQLMVRPPKGVKMPADLRRAVKGERNALLRVLHYVDKINERPYPWD